jgi:predicted chitinase/uncharacterized protein (DUF2345 family)
MSEYKRIRSKLPHPGPYLGIVTNHLDPTRMGGIEVALMRGVTNSLEFQEETFPVQYLSPFYGATNISFEGNDSARPGDAQKSYGWWAIPPDIGTTVMCIFIDGDPNSGYWIGCVADKYQNYEIPGLAASQNVELSQDQETKYGTKNLPVTEFNKKTKKLGDQTTPQAINNFTKAVHPFADRLLAQGLLLDTVRGVTSSSARREVPSMVFGISTPGPVDLDSSATNTNYKEGLIGYPATTKVPISRLGGTTFVMDDGDKDGQNELVRLRTRTGHQILLHNSQDLIYIANSKGTAWVELTSNGKIDIYAKDSISIHSENDLNIRADRDINIESGRNFNIKSNQAMDINVFDHFYMIVYNEGKIDFAQDLHFTVNNNYRITVGADMHIAVADTMYQTSGSDMHISTSGSLYESATSDIQVDANGKICVSSVGAMNLASEGDMKQSTGGNFNVGAAGLYLASASEIHQNGPAAAAADPATPATPASTADLPSPIPTYNVPVRSVDSGWSNGNFYKASPMTTIMQRVPMHEPWDQHENINSSAFTPANTDTAAASRPDVVSSGNTAPPANLSSAIPGTCSTAAKQAISNPNAQAGIAALKAACEKAKITSPYAVAAILGIAGGESMWVPQKELYYYTPERLQQIFRSASQDVINKYARWTGSREDFFSFFYGPTFRGANFLGNQTDADGGKYYGRGYIQLTGRGNYQQYATATGLDLINNPDLVNDITLGAEVTVAYFKARCHANQNDPNYINAAIAAVGVNSPDIHARKMDYYQCFLTQLQGTTVTTGSGIPLTDSQGNTVKTGSATQ